MSTRAVIQPSKARPGCHQNNNSRTTAVPPTTAPVSAFNAGAIARRMLVAHRCEPINEVNNTIAFPLVVTRAYNFNGLQSPLDGTTYFANAGSAVPLIWEYVGSDGMPVDSADAMPVISVYGWEGESCDGYLDPEFRELYYQSDPEDPGASGLRYNDLQMRWQQNLQTKAPMEPGCFEIYISSNASCEEQGDGPFWLELN